jgi:hypothetical protein
LSGIIWLASYPKSGNTWMRAFIATYLENPDGPLHINDLPRYALGDSQIEHRVRKSIGCAGPCRTGSSRPGATTSSSRPIT